MTTSARVMPQRRGACPGLSAPMPTGDGLLVRLQPIGTISLAAFAGLCAAAQRHGNGIVEVTSRGSIQVRGLSSRSAPLFAADVAALAIAAEEGVAVSCSPLCGIDAAEIFDCTALAAELRRTLATAGLGPKRGAKISVAMDGGGALDLDCLVADVRLHAEAKDIFQVSLGGDRANAALLGAVAAANAITAVARLLEALAEHGRHARMRDVIGAEGIAPLRSAVADVLIPTRFRESGKRVDNRAGRSAIDTHPLRGGLLARGIGLAFGHADAAALEKLIAAGAEAGASGVRTAPDRVLLMIGLAPEAAPMVAAAAERLGFVGRADDPRRFVAACAGAPVCTSAHIAARAIAPRVTDIAAPYLDGSRTIHISGCAKGCAHAAPAALTVVGTPDGCALVADGSASDAPFVQIPAQDAPAAIARAMRERWHEAGRG